jgi:hypothetical protein
MDMRVDVSKNDISAFKGKLSRNGMSDAFLSP